MFASQPRDSIISSRWFGMAVAAALTWAGYLLTACTAPLQQLAPLLEPLPPPKAVVREPRRQPYTALKPLPVVEMKEEVPKTDWLAQLTRLPKDANGRTDWVRALNDGLISPSPGLDPKVDAQPVFDLNVELVPQQVPEFKATFPHKVHTRMLGCANCHPAIFKMERGGNPITMEKILVGEYCGRCHGKVAFDVITGCSRCHLGMAR
jgi:c(7)-type cytochrome triheme protein